MTYAECYRMGCTALAEAGIEEANLDARLLLEYVCSTNRNDLLVHGDVPVQEEQAKVYEALIKRRAERIPLQHLTGEQEFMGLSFWVSEKVLIPRQDTEVLVEEVLRDLHDGSRILDMCTGSGCILISLLHYSNDCSGLGVDISEAALQVARENAARHGLVYGGTEHAEMSRRMCGKGDIQFLQSDLFEKVTGKFEIIVSNPPYIRSDVIPTLMPEVRNHEPLSALDGYEDGLFFYRKIIEEAPAYLTGGGRLYFEIGCEQGQEVSALMEQGGFTEIQVIKDYAGLDRVVMGTKR